MDKAGLRGLPYTRHYCTGDHRPKTSDVRCLPPAAFWLAVISATLSGQAPREGLQPLPLTQLDERALGADLDNRSFSLTFAQPVPVRDLLLQLVRSTFLSIIPDPAIEGTFMGELKSVTVRQALGLILPPVGLDDHIEGAFIRVGKREPETRLFDVNYLAFSRSGHTTIGGSSAGGSTATVSASTTADVFAEILVTPRILRPVGAP